MKQVPFYSNTPDDTHCLQATFKMVLKYFLPEKEFTWEELERMTAKKDGMWTWVMQGLINMKKLGFTVIIREDFDYRQFIEKGGRYLIEKSGEAVGNEQIRHSDIEQERKIAKEFIKIFGEKTKHATLKELQQLIHDGCLIIANVNSQALNGKDGFVGHFVVIYGYDEDNLYLHDPGLPPVKSRKVPLPLFMKSWEYPNEDSKGFMAFKY